MLIRIPKSDLKFRAYKSSGPGGQHRRAMIYTPEIEAEIRRSSEMLRWESGWDDEGAPQIEIFAWLQAVDFLHAFEGPAPSITPGPEGGVDVHWKTENRELLITFRTEYPPSYYGDNRHGRDRRKGEIVTLHDRIELLRWIKRKA